MNESEEWIAAYRPPATDEDYSAVGLPMEADPRKPIPPYRLFSIGAIVWATVLGGPLGGATALAINFRKVRRYWAAAFTAIAAVGIAAALTSLNGIVGLTGILASYWVAKMLQGSMLDCHARHRGRFYYYPWGILLGVLWIIGIVAGVVAYFVLLM